MSTSPRSFGSQMLLNQHAPIVERILENICLEDHPHCNKETLRELGYVSLMEATLNQKPSTECFERYAKILIQGRMIQYLFALG